MSLVRSSSNSNLGNNIINDRCLNSDNYPDDDYLDDDYLDDDCTINDKIIMENLSSERIHSSDKKINSVKRVSSDVNDQSGERCESTSCDSVCQSDSISNLSANNIADINTDLKRKISSLMYGAAIGGSLANEKYDFLSAMEFIFFFIDNMEGDIINEFINWVKTEYGIMYTLQYPYMLHVLGKKYYQENPAGASRSIWLETGLYTNECLLRGIILGCIENSLSEIQTISKVMCKITHYDPRCVAAVYGLAYCINMLTYGDVRLLQNGVLGLSHNMISQGMQIYKEEIKKMGANDMSIQDLQEYYILTGSKIEHLNLKNGNALKTYSCAIWAIREYWRQANDNVDSGSIFMQILDKIKSHSESDAEINCIICGAILGILVGFRYLPRYLVNKLGYADKIDCYIKKLS